MSAAFHSARERRDYYLTKTREAEDLAAAATNPQDKARFIQSARQWRQFADVAFLVDARASQERTS